MRQPLLGAVDVEAGFGALDREAVAGPGARLEVHVALVLSGASLRDTAKLKSGWALYCVEWLRRTWSSARPLVGRR